ncbi:MAG: hypothetical protein A2606_01215 [Candidatus Yanofskybacteria bacterium RIFOXYD1_FULL_42_10]|uniref:Uncharacterized protein n=1 Tax=Candidatus Yanofskybacteria bacterium RIFOXYD1_FULL_42_10 TaxID=1802718 RepID=A0A1F8HWS1_9BACT|nr:MAG: hypothetical protein A2606_01215 [Candidatus Yanofskybacteria bacterium RIFOXYD1_FULL_42_10]
MNLETTQKLLKLRDFLQTVSQISFSFTTLNRQYPINTLSELDSEGLVRAYSDLIKKTKELSNEFEHEHENNVL